MFAPHIDTGDHVVIVNADKVVLTPDKAEPQAGVPPQRLPGRHQVRDATASCSPASRPTPSAAPQGHAAQGPARPPDAHQAEGVRRPRPPARRPVARAARPVRGPAPADPETEPDHGHHPAHPDHRPPQGGRRPRPPAPRHRHVTSTAARSTRYFTTPAHRMEAIEPLRVAEATERFDVDATITRRRRQRPGRRAAHGARPLARRARAREPHRR